MKTLCNNTIFRYFFRNQRGQLLALTVSLIAFELLIHWVLSSTIFTAIKFQFLQLLPPQFRSFLGEEGMGLFTPLGIITICYSHPFVYILFSAYAISVFSREIASAREKRILEYMLSYPLSRKSYSATLIISFLLGLLILGAGLTTAVAVSLSIFDLDYGILDFTFVILNLLSLIVFIGGLSFFLSAWARNFSQAVGLIIGFTLGPYFLEYIGRNLEIVGYTSIINPFHYYRPQTVLISGDFPLKGILVLLGGSVLIFTGGWFKFNRRDL